MSTIELVGGIVGGALTGCVSAFFTARGQVNSVRKEYEGRIAVLETQRQHDVDDRNAAALSTLVTATVELASALRDPGPGRYNVITAQAAVNVAVGPFADTNRGPLVKRLVAASSKSNLADVEAVLADLQSSA